MSAQAEMGFAHRPDPAAIGKDGRRAWFWQDNQWQVGRAWEIRNDGHVGGMCRDYGPWGSTFKPRYPCQTHGFWPPQDVVWKKPADQYAKPNPELVAA